MKIIMIGTTMKVEPAICRANWLSFCPLSSDSPTDKVYSFSSFAIMSEVAQEAVPSADEGQDYLYCDNWRRNGQHNL